MGSQKMKIKAITFLLLINLLLTMTLGCVSNTEQNPVEVADEPNETVPTPTQTPTQTSTPTSTPTPIVIETYDDEEFLTWLNDSMSLIKNYTVAIIVTNITFLTYSPH